ncbi:MAG: RNA polymerase factor sigma-54, partial [Deltaproteobacteria bacterium]|nr:RNA polymerase factor sigma-54 [Deltaproteobacteria bacterium]
DDGEESNLEATLTRSETLQEHLLWQLEMAPLSDLEKIVGELLIGDFDDDGYLTVSIRELMESHRSIHEQLLQAIQQGTLSQETMELPDEALMDLKHIPASLIADTGARKKKEPPRFDEDGPGDADDQENAKPFQLDLRAAAAVEAVLRHIQLFDPMGVGARTLAECLEIQLCLMGMEGQLAWQIVHNDLKLLENKDLRKVARRRKTDLEEVLEAYKLIMALEPKPGRPFVRDGAQSIIPDVYIYKAYGESEDSENRVGQYRVVLNETGIPRLRISDFYRQMAEETGKATGDTSSAALTQEYIQEKIKAGNWLMKSIEQRQKTIMRVTKSILKHQYDFFEKGISHLKPLVLKDVAEDIEVHESTVSRITTNKYVHTPQGIFELKYFFTSGIDQGSGEVISSKKIKDMISRIIGGEDAREPLTDIQIAEMLSKESKIKVARRTVAKYREALNLLPSNKRKKMF